MLRTIANRCFAHMLGIGTLFRLVAVLLMPLVLLSSSQAEMVIWLADEIEIERMSSTNLPFALTEVPEQNWLAKGHQVRLVLDARIKWGGLGGYTSGMRVAVNGKDVQGCLVMNKPLQTTLRNGSVYEWAKRTSGSYTLYYSANFSEEIRLFIRDEYVYGIPDDKDAPFHFVWNVTSLVQPGSNTISVSASATPQGTVLGDVRVEIGPPIPSANEDLLVSPAPTGELEAYTPKPPPAFPSLFVSPAGGLRFTAGGRMFQTRSATSLTNGAWADDGVGNDWQLLPAGASFDAVWTGDNYAVHRRITRYADHIAIADTVTNTSPELIGIIFENRLVLPEPPEQVLISGSQRPLKRGRGPDAMAQYANGVVGMVVEDDVLRLHADFFEDADVLGFVDQSLGIAPGASHTLEWSLYSLEGGDYWDFINAIRRNWGCNFELQGPVDFPCGKRFTYVNTRNQTVDDAQEWLDENNGHLPFVMTHVAVNPSISMATATRDNPAFKHGTAILEGPWYLDITRTLVELLKEADPSVKVFAYLHKNLCSEVGFQNKYADSLALNAYGNPVRPPETAEIGMFMPMVGNSYGEALKAVYMYLVTNLNAHIYLDEFNHAYSVPGDGDTIWDGCTVTIHSTSHKVTSKRSSPFLLVQPWLAELMDYLKANGRTAIANSPPPTRTAANWRLQHFVEDSGPSGMISMHLSTPLAWSYRRGQEGFNHLMESLDYGGIAFTRAGDWSDHLFPITPIELRAGIVIGRERILTNRSGRFGWGDDSRAAVYVYDGQGRLVANPDTRAVKEDGRILTEIRMPSDHFAILVKASYLDKKGLINIIR